MLWKSFSKKTVDVMGPLSKLWNILEGAKGEQEEEELVKLEVKEMLKKGVIREVQPSKVEIVSNLSLGKKKDRG